MDPTRATAANLLELMASGAATAEQVARAYLDRADRLDGRLHVYLHRDDDAALAQARRVDARRKAGEPLGPLAGVPVALKDVLCTKGEPTTCGSLMLKDFRPPYDATVVRKLREADAVLIGRTNMDEFAMGSSTENSAYGPDPQPVGRRAHPGRLVGGLGRRRRRRLRARGAGLGHRRLDPAAGRAVRDRRHEADLRPREPLRPDRLRQLARPGRPLRARRGRRRPCAQGDRRPRPDGRDQLRRAGARLSGPAGRSSDGPAHRPGSRVFRRRARPGGRGGRARGRPRVRGRRRDGPRRFAAPLEVRDRGLLPGRDGRMLEQPGALRRHDLRPSRGRLLGRRPPRKRSCRL